MNFTPCSSETVDWNCFPTLHEAAH